MERILVFFDGSTVMADQSIIEEAKKYGRDAIVVGDSAYKLSAISKNLSLTDFYQQYPDKRPPDKKNEVAIEDVRPMTPEEVKRMNDGLLRGLKRFIDEMARLGVATPIAQKMYDDARTKGFNKNGILQKMPG